MHAAAAVSCRIPAEDPASWPVATALHCLLRALSTRRAWIECYIMCMKSGQAPRANVHRASRINISAAEGHCSWRISRTHTGCFAALRACCTGQLFAYVIISSRTPVLTSSVYPACWKLLAKPQPPAGVGSLSFNAGKSVVAMGKATDAISTS